MFNEESEILRAKLLEVNGIGRETADCILLYAGNKLSFPSDAYTKRIMTRLGLISEDWKYDDVRNYFMKNIEEDLKLYNDFHAQIVHHGNQICRTKPECGKCPIRIMGKMLKCSFALNNNFNFELP